MSSAGDCPKIRVTIDVDQLSDRRKIAAAEIHILNDGSYHEPADYNVVFLDSKGKRFEVVVKGFIMNTSDSWTLLKEALASYEC